MEILKNCAKWYIHTSWSNQIAIGIIIIAIMVLITKYGFMKMGWSWLKIGSPWKIFWKMVSLGAIVGICYGFYLLALYCWPTPEKLAFRELSRNLAELELQPEKNKLAFFNKKIKNGTPLTEWEKKQAMEANKKIERVREDYSEGNLVPPPPKIAAKPKKEVLDWVFRWERNDGQWEKAKAIGRKKKGEKYQARLLEITPAHLKMEYVSGYSGKTEEVLLKVGNTGDFYATDYYVKSKKPKEIDLSLKVSLKKDPESPGNFVGTFWQDQDNQQVDCWLSKK